MYQKKFSFPKHFRLQKYRLFSDFQTNAYFFVIFFLPAHNNRPFISRRTWPTEYFFAAHLHRGKLLIEAGDFSCRTIRKNRLYLTARIKNKKKIGKKFGGV
jgi:hypothetical protein